MNSGGSDMTIKDIIDAQATIIQGLSDKDFFTINFVIRQIYDKFAEKALKIMTTKTSVKNHLYLNNTY